MKAVDAWKRSGWKTRTAVILAFLYLVYALVGFFVLPNIVREQASRALADLTGRQVHISEVRINPLALSATVNVFAIRDDQTRVLLGFKKLYVNFELSSLFRWSWHFDKVSLDGLTLRAQRNPGNHFSFDDVISHIEKQQAAAPEPEKPAKKHTNGALPPVSIATLSLTHGDLRYTEATARPSEQVVLPVAFTIKNFATRAEKDSNNHYVLNIEGPDGGKLDWDGRFDLDPLVAQGSLKVQNVDLVQFARLLHNQVRFQVPSGMLNVGLTYRFVSDPEPVLHLSKGNIELRNLVVQKPGANTASVTLPKTRIDGVSVDTRTQLVEIPRVVLSQPTVVAQRNDDGIDLETLFLPADNGSADEDTASVNKDAAPVTDDSSAETGPSWRIKLDHLAMEDSQLSLRDTTLKPARTVALTQGQLSLDNLVVGEDNARFHWQGSGKLLGSGELKHSGEGQLSPLQLDMKAQLAALPLTPLSPWLQQQAPLSLTKGQLGLDLQASVKGAAPVVTVQGNADVANLAVREEGQPWVSVSKLKVANLDANTDKQTLAIGQVTVAGLDLLNKVNASGQDSASRIIAGMPADNASEAPAQSNSKPWLVQVKQLRLQDSTVKHQDDSLKPRFSVGLYKVHGTVSNLDSRPGHKARINLEGQVDRTAPFSAKGSVSPDPLFVNLDVSLQNYEMTSLTPYTGRYLGFQVEKGQLGVDATVDIDKGKLKSGSQVAASQFYLGDKVSSDEAVKAPVKLGLAVLRDSHGEIALPLDMAGDLEDPSFSVGGLVLKVLGNIIVKAATSPFSVLSSLAGGKNLENIAFAAGNADVAGDTRSSLQALAKVLQKRPNLNVGLSGSTDAEDRKALAGQAIGKSLAGEAWPGIESALQDKQWRRPLIRRYQRQFDRDAQTLVSSLPDDPEQREQTLARAAWQAMVNADAKRITTATLQELAKNRAVNAKAWLVQQQGIDQGRLFIKNTQLDHKVAGLTLDLEKR
ncbi:MAG: DUF748 domain-containing protein [Alcanivorax sp.]|nr:DUF748 domain-containing protein [Alcanivorax sp.]